MGARLCVEDRGNIQDTNKEWGSKAYSYRTEYFSNAKHPKDFCSIDIQRIRFAKIKHISTPVNSNSNFTYSNSICLVQIVFMFSAIAP